MNLHLTRDEADRLDTDGRVVLFRSPARCSRCNTGARFANEACWQCRSTGHNPPAEFVEAAKPCETCGGEGYASNEMVMGAPCPDCLDGKRRTAAVVRRQADQVRWDSFLTQPPRYPTTRIVTVGHVVVEWGPLPMVRPGIDIHNPPIDCVAITRLGFVLHIVGKRPVNVGTLSPDIDPQSLVGQWAIGIKVVEP